MPAWARRISLELRLEARGPIRPVLFLGEPVPPPSMSLDEALTAVQGHARVVSAPPLVVQ